MSAPDEMLGAAERGTRAASGLGAQRAEVYLWSARSWETREAGGLRTIQEADESGVSVRVAVDGRCAAAQTSGVGDDAVGWATRRAIGLARSLPPSTTPWPLPPPPLGALRPPTPIDPRLADPDPERLLALVEEAADAMRDTKGVDYASTSLVTHHGRFVVANTNGLLVWDQNAHEAFAGEVRGAHEAEARTKRVAIQERRALDATRDLAAPLRDAVALATQRGAREPLGSAVSDVILDAGAAVQLVSQLLASFAGHGANDGRSRFAGKIGERVASENVTIVDDPTDGVGIRNYRVDDEGTPTRGALTIIERGTLVSHAHDFRSAQAAGRDATGHGLRSLNGRYGATPSARLGNAVVEPGRESLAQIVEGAERAVLLQGSLLGSFTINTITGDVACTSPMAHLVDGGKVVAQLRPVTLGGNLFDALKDCRAIGASGLRYPRGSCPALRLGKLTAMT